MKHKSKYSPKSAIYFDLGSEIKKENHKLDFYYNKTDMEVGAVTQKEINTECKILTYINLSLTIFGLVMVAVLHYRKPKLCRGHIFSNTVKIMIFISDAQYYVPIK